MENRVNGQSRQKYLGDKGLVVFLALLSAFVPLSTDLYLPALPMMLRFFAVSELEMNLTLILFFVFYALTTLIWGPLSDKYGRRPILQVGMSAYMVASILCALSADVYQLILFRILQAAGGGAAAAVATAVVKDVYRGKKQESVLAVIQSMVVISPAVAPVLGALLLRFTSWRGVFWTQALLGAIVVAGSFAFQETIVFKNHNANLMRMMSRLGVVLKNPGFTLLLVIFSTVNVASMAFISSSSYIYQDNFGLSSQTYSYFFTFNAVGMLLGPIFYVRLAWRCKRFSIINACFIITIVSGMLVCLFGKRDTWLFAVTLLPATVATSAVRPPSTYLMLQQQQKDTGAVSSLITALAIAMGSVGMILVSVVRWNLVLVVGWINILIGVLCGGAWLLATKAPYLSKIRKQS
ncbi:MAG: Bcr/CflA family efflux MFS transporter [Sporolactobacillus sp.]|jgi:DHA1 family bicyclomycin/chloramphenicol resistance-like MFS transporter|nr:Bcr/CflA family efflux MFS transporter [Sporolactobacillus sp.]